MATRQGNRPEALVTVAGALVDKASKGTQGAMEIVAIDDKGADIRVKFGEPKLSDSGKSYLVTYASGQEGSLRIVVTAYIPLGKDRAPRRQRQDEPFSDQRDAAQRRYAPER